MNSVENRHQDLVLLLSELKELSEKLDIPLESVLQAQSILANERLNQSLLSVQDDAGKRLILMMSPANHRDAIPSLRKRATTTTW